MEMSSRLNSASSWKDREGRQRAEGAEGKHRGRREAIEGGTSGRPLWVEGINLDGRNALAGPKQQ